MSTIFYNGLTIIDIRKLPSIVVNPDSNNSIAGIAKETFIGSNNSLKGVSYTNYNTEDYWYLIGSLNSTNEYDMYMGVDELNNYCIRYYGNINTVASYILNGRLANLHESGFNRNGVATVPAGAIAVTIYEYLDYINESKQYMTLLTPKELNKVVTENYSLWQ